MCLGTCARYHASSSSAAAAAASLAALAAASHLSLATSTSYHPSSSATARWSLPPHNLADEVSQLPLLGAERLEELLLFLQRRSLRRTFRRATWAVRHLGRVGRGRWQ